MLVKNKKGSEREFKLLFKLEKNKESYLVYQDQITSKIYSGKRIKDTLKPVDEEEIKMLNNILERING